MARKRTGVAATKARASLREHFERMLDELATAGRKMSGSEVESLVAEAVAESRRKVRAVHAGRNARPRKR
jgi:hypothetical protein